LHSDQLQTIRFLILKWVVTIEKLELHSYGQKGQIMQFDFPSNKNAPRYKKFEKLNSNKNQAEMV